MSTAPLPGMIQRLSASTSYANGKSIFLRAVTRKTTKVLKRHVAFSMDVRMQFLRVDYNSRKPPPIKEALTPAGVLKLVDAFFATYVVDRILFLFHRFS